MVTACDMALIRDSSSYSSSFLIEALGADAASLGNGRTCEALEDGFRVTIRPLAVPFSVFTLLLNHSCSFGDSWHSITRVITHPDILSLVQLPF